MTNPSFAEQFVSCNNIKSTCTYWTDGLNYTIVKLHYSHYLLVIKLLLAIFLILFPWNWRSYEFYFWKCLFKAVGNCLPCRFAGTSVFRSTLWIYTQLFVIICSINRVIFVHAFSCRLPCRWRYCKYCIGWNICFHCHHGPPWPGGSTQWLGLLAIGFALIVRHVIARDSALSKKLAASSTWVSVHRVVSTYFVFAWSRI